MLAGKFPALLGLLSSLDVLIGHKVVQDNGNAVLVKNLVEARLAEFLDGNGGGDVVAQNQVQLGGNQLARNNGVKPRVGREDFLGHGHSHGLLSSLNGAVDG